MYFIHLEPKVFFKSNLKTYFLVFFFTFIWNLLNFISIDFCKETQTKTFEPLLNEVEKAYAIMLM